MKSKKLLFSSLFMGAGLISFITLTSSSNASQGVMGASTTGCSCHGTASTATTVDIAGVPTGGFENGKTYALTLNITNSTKSGAGFDMTVTSGTMSNAPSGTMLMGGTELHHTATKSALSGVTSWSFSWTAPATGSTVSFKVAANAVNGNNSDNGDAWSLASKDYSVKPSSITNFKEASFSLFPNPTFNNLTFQSETNIENAMFTIVTLNGAIMPTRTSKLNEKAMAIETSSLAAGNYILVVSQNGKQSSQLFSKQ